MPFELLYICLYFFIIFLEVRKIWLCISLSLVYSVNESINVLFCYVFVCAYFQISMRYQRQID